MQLFDRVQETSTTEGTGDFTLDGAVLGFRSFRAAAGTGSPGIFVETVQNGQAGIYDETLISYYGSPDGTFTLILDGYETDPIAIDPLDMYTTLDAAITAALEALPNVGVGNVFVYSSDTFSNVFFIGSLAYQVMPLLTYGTFVGTSGGDTIVELVAHGQSPVNEIQTIQFVGVQGGTYALQVGDGGSYVTGLAITLSPADLKTAILAHYGAHFASGDLSITGTTGAYYSIEFTGAYAAADQPESVVNASGIDFLAGETEGVYYSIVHQTENEWECGIGKIYDADQLLRTLILSNSSQTTSAISFTAGTKNVFCDPTALAVFNQFDTFEVPSSKKQEYPEPEMLFGDGSDGDLTISSGTTTLSSAKYYDTLTLSGGNLVADGYRIHAKMLKITSGSINADGANGSTATAGTGGSAPTTPSVGEYDFGIGNVSAGRGTAGSNGYVSTPTSVTSATAVPTGDGGGVTTRLRPPIHYWLTGQVAGGGTGGTGGVGGSGSGGNTGGGGGSGGNGGGRLIIIADTVINSGTISAKGGNGGNGAAGTATNTNGGAGGSAGSGGFVYIVCRKYIGTLPTCAAGSVGSGGASGGGSGSAGVSGSAGTAGNFVIYELSTGTYRVNA